jgi:hypothetical protein
MTPLYEEKSISKDKLFLSLVELEIWKELPKYMVSLASVLTNDYRQAVESKKLKHAIQARIAQLTPAINSEEPIKDFGDAIIEMSNKLVELSRHIAHVQVTNESIAFIPEGKVDPALEEAIAQLPKKEDLSSTQFKSFINAVRSRYSPAISDWSVEMLLNFYQYQMAYVETTFRSSLREFFSKVRGRVQNEEALREEILTIDKHPEQQKRESLTAKREILKKLCKESDKDLS